MSDPFDSTEFCELLRDLCVGVSMLAGGTVHLVGTTHAREVINTCIDLSCWLDERETDDE